MKISFLILMVVAFAFSDATNAFATGDCTDFVDLTGSPLPISVVGTTAEATDDNQPFDFNSDPPECWQGQWVWACGLGPDKTFKWTAPQAGYYAISLAGSDYNANLFLYDFTCPVPPVYPEDFICGSHNNLQGAGFVSDLLLTAGQEILIVVDGYGNSSGDFELGIDDNWTPSTVIDTTISCQSLGFDRDVRVYLPYNYDSDGLGYPVVYFLHGAVVTYNWYWTNASLRDSLDSLIEDERIQPIIFVCPDGSIGPYAGSFYTNSELYGDFEDAMVHDVIAFVDTTFNTNPFRQCRAVMGHSMGGYGAMKLALKHPDVYCAVASHSGPLDLSLAVSVRVDAVIAQNDCPDCPPYIYDPAAGWSTMLFFTYAGAFSPNLENPPYFVDFPLDPWGEIDASVMARWHEHDPPHLASELPQYRNLAIYFDCGLQDELDFLPLNEAFADSLDELGIPYEFQSYVGDHTNQVGRQIPIALEFLNANMTCTIVDVDDSTPKDLRTLRTAPNPFNPHTTISFSMKQAGWAEVSIYDLMGRRVVRLANRNFTRGSHTLTWTGRDDSERTMPSGTYIVRLETDSGVEARKVMLVR